MDIKEILKIIVEAGKTLETVEIYYPQTNNHPEGWREVDPYSIRKFIGGGELRYGLDVIEPNNFFYAYNSNSNDSSCHAFVIGKIGGIRTTNNKFIPKTDWKVEF